MTAWLGLPKNDQKIPLDIFRKRAHNIEMIMTITQIQELIFERSMPIPFCGCWIWMGARGTTPKDSYGKIRLVRWVNRRRVGKTFRAHRVSYRVFKGPIFEGLIVGHTCYVKLCVNPDHLKLMTNKENMNDMDMVEIRLKRSQEIASLPIPRYTLKIGRKPGRVDISSLNLPARKRKYVRHV